MPDKVAPYLTRDQLALYQLIWQRFIASQMQEALIDQVSASIAAGPFVFTASGSAVRFPGFMALYQADEEDNGTNGEKGKEPLPDLKERDRLTLHRLEPSSTSPSPRPGFPRLRW